MCIGNTCSHLHSVGVGGGQGRIGASWLSFRPSWLQSRIVNSSTEAVVFTHPDVDHILGNQAGCHSTERMQLDFLQVTSDKSLYLRREEKSP